MGVLRTIFHIITFGIVDSNEEVARKNTPFSFGEAFSREAFTNIVDKTAKFYKRLQVEVSNQFVRGTVRSNSGISTWEFIIDFNDFGRVTGNYWWKRCENSDSDLPKAYAEELKKEIVKARQK